MGAFGSTKGTRGNAWRNKKRYMTTLPEIPVSKLIHAHRGDSLDNQFALGKLKCKIHPFSILLEHDEKIPLEIPEIEITAFPCYYGGDHYYDRCPACNR